VTVTPAVIRCRVLVAGSVLTLGIVALWVMLTAWSRQDLPPCAAGCCGGTRVGRTRCRSPARSPLGQAALLHGLAPAAGRKPPARP
jgi:hypothetical protein